ncbi:hypothetical protein GCM10009682_25010 [Luedemannella flava]|uniref:IPT/TIG domain-containing protein n=1 Tax=Luedemannella flava TaxID=349316 RepID=A0ABN2LYY2_9ACTN
MRFAGGGEWASVFQDPPMSTTGGVQIMVTGEFLSRTSEVVLSGRTALAFQVLDDTRLGAVLPATVTSGYLTVRTPGGVSATGSNARLRLEGTGPIVARVIRVESCADPEPAGYTLLVEGSALGTAYAAAADGSGITPIQVLSDTQVAVRLPAGRTNAAVTVYTSRGMSSPVHYDNAPLATDRACIPLY